MTQSGLGLSEGTVFHVLRILSEKLANSLAEGYSVSLDEIGTFKATIGLRKNKKMDCLNENETQRNVASLQVIGVYFRADKSLDINTASRCQLTRVGISKLHRFPFTKEERLQMAVNYLSNPAHPVMRIADYAAMTELSCSTAANELVEFRNNPESGITTSGHNKSKDYSTGYLLFGRGLGIHQGR